MNSNDNLLITNRTLLEDRNLKYAFSIEEIL